jgi:excisionase family DNA binding protein
MPPKQIAAPDPGDTLAYSPTQAARVVGRSHSRIKLAIRRGELKALKDGRCTLIERSELQRWLATLRTVGREPEPATTAAKDGARTTLPPRPRSIARIAREETRR